MYKGQKFTNAKEKKGLFGPKKQAGAELKNKNRIFWAKSRGKKEYKGPTLTNLKEKKRLFGPKKQAWAELKQKKRIFWAKNWGKN